MGDYERSTTVDASVDDLFDYLSRVENLPEYFDRMTQARPATGDAVEVEAKLDADAVGETGQDAGDGDRTVRGEAWFRVDADRRAVSWGAQGPHHYSGELQVRDDADARAATVTVRLHTEHDDPEAINAGLDQTLANIARLAATRPEITGP